MQNSIYQVYFVLYISIGQPENCAKNFNLTHFFIQKEGGENKVICFQTRQTDSFFRKSGKIKFKKLKLKKEKKKRERK